MLKKILVGLLCTTLLMGYTPSSALTIDVLDETSPTNIIYVNTDSNTSGDGENWNSAY
jgi:hypothetical protein